MKVSHVTNISDVRQTPSMELLYPVIKARIRRNWGGGSGNEESGLRLLFIGGVVLAISSGPIWS